MGKNGRVIEFVPYLTHKHIPPLTHLRFYFPPPPYGDRDGGGGNGIHCQTMIKLRGKLKKNIVITIVMGRSGIVAGRNGKWRDEMGDCFVGRWIDWLRTIC